MDEFDSCQQRDLELDEDEFVDFWSQFRKLILTFFEILMKNCIFDRVFLDSRSVFLHVYESGQSTFFHVTLVVKNCIKTKKSNRPDF